MELLLSDLSTPCGATVQKIIPCLAAYTRIFRNNEHISGIIAQISPIIEPAADGALYLPVLTDFIFMIDKTRYLFPAGPDVIY
ncbi:MAG: hypothetical protein N2Z72_01425 [Bacteroidales bacterium]|nr:hypothetical protein [Bacteroidales bacterium]